MPTDQNTTPGDLGAEIDRIGALIKHSHMDRIVGLLERLRAVQRSLGSHLDDRTPIGLIGTAEPTGGGRKGMLERVVTEPVELACRVEHLIVSPGSARQWAMVHGGLKLGGRYLSSVNDAPVPLEVFSVDAYALGGDVLSEAMKFTLPMVDAGTRIELTVQALCDDPQPFRGVLWVRVPKAPGY